MTRSFVTTSTDEVGGHFERSAQPGDARADDEHVGEAVERVAGVERDEVAVRGHDGPELNATRSAWFRIWNPAQPLPPGRNGDHHLKGAKALSGSGESVQKRLCWTKAAKAANFWGSGVGGLGVEISTARVPRMPSFGGRELASLLVRNCTARVPSRKFHKGHTDHRGVFSAGVSSVSLW